jgi:hypothetical protein
MVWRERKRADLMAVVLTQSMASSFARVALAHVIREYPNKLGNTLRGPEDARTPRALHPLFYGSFDWHSCVHGYWLLFRLARRFPDLTERDGIRALANTQITTENVARELAYLETAEAFERPYGWAWLLMLAAELRRHDSEDGQRWGATLAPLAAFLSRRFAAWLVDATYPVRSGAHSNSAFALTLALDYARGSGDDSLASLVQRTAARWFQRDADCQAWEPDGEDFLSPALMEAVLMQRVLPATEFAPWFDRFLPRLVERSPAALFEPADVSNRRDGKIVHLDGLNLSRAWCWRSLASAVDAADPRQPLALSSAEAHLAESLPHITGDYAGEHWLATFALLALDA